MNKAYLYLFIGTILIFFSLGIIFLDLIIHIAGYGLMILGIFFILKKRDSNSLIIANQLIIGLILFELLKVGISRIILSSPLLSILIMTLILVAQLSIFYLIIKAEGDATESLDVQTYQQAELLFSIALVFLYFISYFSTFAFTLFSILNLFFYIFIIHVFYKLLTMYQH
ncbi:MAG: hypothetical protein UIL36_03220 [Turicibacter sp.]|nr:hypothetical protein [Turicibacter sp.]